MASTGVVFVLRSCHGGGCDWLLDAARVSRHHLSVVYPANALWYTETRAWVSCRSVLLFICHPLRNALQFDGESVHGLLLILDRLPGVVLSVLPLKHLLLHAAALLHPTVEFPLHGVEGVCRLLSGGSVVY